MKIVKIGKILLWLTTWMSRLDRMLNPDKCYTNPFLATFLLYVFLVMGVARGMSGSTYEIQWLGAIYDLILPHDVTATAYVISSLDDIYDLMLPNDQGLGIMCMIFLGAETIMLYGGFADLVTRGVIIVIVANVFYMMGLFMPLVGPVMLMILAVAYIYTLFVIIRFTIRHIRQRDVSLYDSW